MRWEVAALLGALAVLAVLLFTTGARQGSPTTVQISVEEINEISPYTPVELNIPLDHNVDLNTLPPEEVVLPLPESV